jgi:hypothetical protein
MVKAVCMGVLGSRVEMGAKQDMLMHLKSRHLRQPQSPIRRPRSHPHLQMPRPHYAPSRNRTRQDSSKRSPTNSHRRTNT